MVVRQIKERYGRGGGGEIDKREIWAGGGVRQTKQRDGGGGSQTDR